MKRDDMQVLIALVIIVLLYFAAERYVLENTEIYKIRCKTESGLEVTIDKRDWSKERLNPMEICKESLNGVIGAELE